MPLSSDITTVNIYLITQSINGDFLDNLIQFINNKQGVATAILGIITLIVLAIQALTMCRQTSLLKESNSTSKKALKISNELKKISINLKILESREKDLPILMKSIIPLEQKLINLMVKDTPKGSLSLCDDEIGMAINVFTKTIDTLRRRSNDFEKNYKDIWEKTDSSGNYLLKRLTNLIANINLGKINKVEEITSILKGLNLTVEFFENSINYEAILL